MTIAEKLRKILTIKNSIKAAIVAKGVSVDSDTPFEDYPSKIGEIEGGGSPEPSFIMHTIIGNEKISYQETSIAFTIDEEV